MEGKMDSSNYLNRILSSDSVTRLKKKSSLKSLSKYRDVNLGVFDSSNDSTIDVSEMMHSEIFQKQLRGVKLLRKLLVKKTDETKQNTDAKFIDEVIDNDLLPLVVKFLNDPNYRLQEEAAWIITNLATGDTRQTRYLVESGAVEFLIKLLCIGCDRVCERAAWALGNIAGDCTDFRDYVLRKGATDGIVRVLRNSTNIPLLQTATWLLSILSMDVKEKDYEKLIPAIPYIRDLLAHSDSDLVSQCCWCLASLSSGGNNRINDIMESKVPMHLVPLFSKRNQILPAVLQIVGNIVSGDECSTQMMIDLGIIGQVSKLLFSSDSSTRRAACWIMSNVSAGSVRQVQALIQLNTIPTLLSLLTTDSENTRTEVVWALRNFTRSGNTDQLMYLVESGVIQKLCHVLKTADEEVILMVLDTLEVLLQLGESDFRVEGEINQIALIVEKCKGIENLETLLSHKSTDVYRKTFDILEKYFNG